MGNYIKTLILSTIVLVIGNNSNYCYSMEEQQININQNNRIRYSNQDTPTVDQMVKCANFEPIDLDSDEYNRCFDFFEENGMEGIKCLLEIFLQNIYGLSLSLSFDSSGYHRPFYLFHYINSYNSQETVADAPDSRVAQKKQFLENQNLSTNNIAEYVTLIMDNIHKHLNPNRNNERKYNDVQDKVNDLMKLCYYIANHFVELSHDILCKINKKIDEYRTNQDTYSFEEFRNYIEDQVIIPSYKSVIKIINNVLEVLSADSIVIKNDYINGNSVHNILESFFKDIRFNCNYFKKEYNYYLLYGSRLYHELHVKRNKILNDTFYDSIKELSTINKQNNQYFNLESKVINAHILEIERLRYKDFFHDIMLNGSGIHPYLNPNNYYVVVGNEISVLLNADNATVVNRANNYLAKVAQMLCSIRNINKSIDNTFTQREKQILRSYFWLNEHKNYYDKLLQLDLERLFNYEQRRFSKQINQFNNAIKNFDKRLINVQFEPMDATPDYIGELRNSFNKYKEAGA